jgi:TonB-linked SusC/RagA family outer membrane protein
MKTHKRLYATLCILFTLGKALAQEASITGIITDSLTSETLPGVSVIVKGTLNGTASDMNGKFEIKLRDGNNVIREGNNAILVFKYLGYKEKQIAIAGSSVINVSLSPETNAIKEIVVTALGISQEKKKLGYAVQEIKGEKLTIARDNNFLNNLSGNIAGAQVTGSSGGVGSSANIILRGYKSLTGTSQPLFVIDGIPYNNSSGNIGEGNTQADYGNAASNINPDDVESISVLKGAAATAIYGARGSNGVILITTKSAKNRKDNQIKGLGVDYNLNVGFETPFVVPKFQNKYGQGKKGQFQWVDGNGGGIYDDYDQSWGPELDNGLLIDQFTGKAQPWVSQKNNYQDFLQTGRVMTNNIALSGANDKGYLRASYTNFDQKGMIPNNDLKKNTVSVNAGADITEKFNVSSVITYVNERSTNRSKVGYGNETSGYDNPLNQFIWGGRNLDWNYLKDHYQVTNPDETHSQINWLGYYSNNPYWLINKNTNSFQRDRYTGSLALRYKLAPWLTAQGRLLSDFYTQQIKERTAIGTWGAIQSLGGYNQTDASRGELNKELLLFLNTDLSTKISVDATVGANQRTDKVQNNYLEVQGLFKEDVYSTDNAINSPIETNFISNKRINSLFGSANVTYNRAVSLGGTYRTDWTSTLVKGNPFSYYSVSGTWSFTETFKFAKWFSFGKVRANYAKVGSDVAPYSLYNVMNKGDKFDGVYPFTNPTIKYDPNLQPEDTKSIELGTELKFFQNRLGLDITYYNATTYNQIFTVGVSASSGYTGALLNGGSINNKGVEIQVYGSPIRNEKGLNWDILLNYTKNVNKVVEIDPSGRVKQYALSSLFGTIIYAEEGKPFGTIYGYKMQRDAAGHIIVDSKGRPKTTSERYDLGNASPDFLASITNTFSHKNVMISFLIDSRIGGKIFSGTNFYGAYAGQFDYTLEGRDGTYIVPNSVKEDPANPGQYLPNDIQLSAESYWTSNSNRLDEFVYDATFVKLRQATIAYKLPGTWVKKIKLQDITLSVYGRNLWLIHSKLPNVDPETAFSPGTAGLGVEYIQAPSARTIGFSISAKF